MNIKLDSYTLALEGSSGNPFSGSASFNNVAGEVMIFAMGCTSANGVMTITTPTYAGVNLIRVQSVLNPEDGRNSYAVYMLENPALGSNTFTYGCSNSQGNANSVAVALLATFSGLKSSGQPDADSQPASGGNTANVDYPLTLTTGVNNTGLMAVVLGMTGSASPGFQNGTGSLMCVQSFAGSLQGTTAAGIGIFIEDAPTAGSNTINAQASQTCTFFPTLISLIETAPVFEGAILLTLIN